MRVLVADWDETITVKDTTQLVVDAAYSAKTGLPDFSHFTRIYGDARHKYDLHYMAANGKHDAFNEEIAYQKGMRLVEMSSISAIVECELFRGLTPDHFKRQASNVQLRTGFVDFANRVYHEGIPMYVLSINWSKTLIEETLSLHGVKGFTVLSNDLEFSNGISTGRFDPAFDIRTGYDKMVELGKIQSLHPESELVYVGDSVGDVLALRTSYTGIIIEGGKARSHFRDVQQLKTCTYLKAGVYEGRWEEVDQVW